MEEAQFHSVDVDSLYDDIAMQQGYIDRPYTVIHMICSADGKAAIAGRTRQLGSAIDRLILRRVRGYCDAVAYGAGTLRAENVDPRAQEEMVAWRLSTGMRRHPLRAIFSNTGNVPLGNRFFQVEGDPPLVFTVQGAGEEVLSNLRQKSLVHSLGRKTVDLAASMRVLREQFVVRRLVVEGGPTLNYSLLRARLVDELFLTVAPIIVGGHLGIVGGQELVRAEAPPLRLLSVHCHESELFLRYRVLSISMIG